MMGMRSELVGGMGPIMEERLRVTMGMVKSNSELPPSMAMGTVLLFLGAAWDRIGVMVAATAPLRLCS